MTDTERDRLNRLVTYAVFHAENTEPMSDAMIVAYTALSRIEERIAELHPADSAEGAIARRGAVSAAAVAEDWARAHQLARQYGITFPESG